MIKVETQHISKCYQKGIRILDDVSFSINSGDIIGVIGRNGAGKSTLFKILAGVLEQDDGYCKMDGQPISLDYSEKVSYMPEIRGLDGRSQVIEHLTDMVSYKGLKRKAAMKYVEEWLEKFSLSDRKYDRIDTLSKGNQQKLQFIIAVASKPELLILDEPFSGLDPIASQELWDVLEYMKSMNCTILFSSHNLSAQMVQCDQFLFIKNGKLVECGTLDTIQDKYNLIVEVKNDTLDLEGLKKAGGNLIYERKADGTYLINVTSEKDARLIFDCLLEPYSELFRLRKMSLNELFYCINGEE